MHCKDTILRTQNNWPYSKFIPNSGNYGKYTYLLEEGDTIYYDSIVPHHVHAFEGQEARILAVIYTPI